MAISSWLTEKDEIWILFHRMKSPATVTFTTNRGINRRKDELIWGKETLIRTTYVKV